MHQQYEQQPFLNQGGGGHPNDPGGQQFQTAYPGGGPPGGGYGPGPQGGGYPQGGPPGAGYGPGPQSGGYGQPAGYGQPGSPPQGGPGLREMPTTTSMHLVFFVAAATTVFGSFIGSLSLLFSGQFVDCLEMVYFFFFGMALMIYDTPFFRTVQVIKEYKLHVGKFAALITRVTGKGLIFVFLGTSLFGSLWANCEAHFLLFMAVVMCVFITFVGFAATFVGIMKSQKLRKAQNHLAQGVLESSFQHHARAQQGGLTPQEFNGLTKENGGIHWEDSDLKLIFNALVSNPSWRIQDGFGEPTLSYGDMQTWVKGGPVWL